MNLQYTITPRMRSGYTLSLYSDGVRMETLVVAYDRNLADACKHIEEAGYVLAYDVQACKEKLDRIQNAYKEQIDSCEAKLAQLKSDYEKELKEAKKEYKKAIAAPLLYSDPGAYTYKISECEIPDRVTVTTYYNGVAYAVNITPADDVDACVKHLEGKGFKRVDPLH